MGETGGPARKFDEVLQRHGIVPKWAGEPIRLVSVSPSSDAIPASERIKRLWRSALSGLGVGEAANWPAAIRKSGHMAQTPAGPLIFVYRLQPTSKQMATLALTSTGDEPNMIVIPPGADLPGVFVHDWKAKDLYVTNISQGEHVDVWLAACGLIPGAEWGDLTAGAPIVLKSGRQARAPADGGYQQLGFEALSGKLTILALIIEGPTGGATEARVYAANAKANTGPGTSMEAPPGYFATTTAPNFSFESFTEEGTKGPVAFYVKNLSPDAAPAKALTRRIV